MDDEVERCLKVAACIRVIEELPTVNDKNRDTMWEWTEVEEVLLDDNMEQAAYLMGGEWLPTDGGLYRFLEKKVEVMKEKKGNSELGVVCRYELVGGKTLREKLESNAEYARRFSKMALGLGAGKSIITARLIPFGYGERMLTFLGFNS